MACDKGNQILRRADHRKPENGSNELHFETHLSICFTEQVTFSVTNVWQCLDFP
jgi:hypothetical protein